MENRCTCELCRYSFDRDIYKATVSEFENTIRVNVLGAFIVSREVSKYMKKEVQLLMYHQQMEQRLLHQNLLTTIFPRLDCRV